MKISLSVLFSAGLILAVVLAELGFGLHWSMESFRLPDADLKPIRPVARFAFTGIVVTGTLLFGGAYLRFAASREDY